MSPSRRRPSRSNTTRPAARQSSGAPRQTGAARRGPLLTPPDQAPTRHQVERRSAVWLLYLSRLPRWVVAVTFAALFLFGALAPGTAGGAALLLVAVLLGWLAFVTWPRVTPPARLVRLLVIAAVLAWGISKIVLMLNSAR